MNKKLVVKLLAATLVSASVICAPVMNANAGVLKTSEKVVISKSAVQDAIKEKKVEMRKNFLRKHGADEATIEKLDELGFFEWEIKDFGKVDVGTYDEVIVTIENANIDIDIYFNFITINK